MLLAALPPLGNGTWHAHSSLNSPHMVLLPVCSFSQSAQYCMCLLLRQTTIPPSRPPRTRSQLSLLSSLVPQRSTGTYGQLGFL